VDPNSGEGNWWTRRSWLRPAPLTDDEIRIAARDRRTLFRSPKVVQISGYYAAVAVWMGVLVLLGATWSLALGFGFLAGISGQVLADHAWVKLRGANSSETDL
jgi:hypothetical protein